MPRLQIKDSAGTMRTIRSLTVMDDTGTPRLLQTLKIKDDTGTLQLVYQYFTAVASPDMVSGSGSSGGTIAITTSASTATPTGGTAPYTYAWTQTSGAGLWTANSPTGAISDFTGYAIGPGDGDDATFICTVTDSLGSVAVTNDVACSVTNFG